MTSLTATDQTHTALAEMLEVVEAGKTHFGEVVRRCIELGVECYHVDLRRWRTTYFANEWSLELSNGHRADRIAAEFDVEAIRDAIRAAQAGRIVYPQFIQLVAAAGCAGYHAFIQGKRVCYYGRNGDQHIEWFPGAGPTTRQP